MRILSKALQEVCCSCRDDLFCNGIAWYECRKGCLSKSVMPDSRPSPEGAHHEAAVWKASVEDANPVHAIVQFTVTVAEAKSIRKGNARLLDNVNVSSAKRKKASH